MAKYLLNAIYIIVISMMLNISQKLTTIVNKDLYINIDNVIYVGETTACQ